jgi:hypothetical protein
MSAEQARRAMARLEAEMKNKKSEAATNTQMETLKSFLLHDFKTRNINKLKFWTGK